VVGDETVKGSETGTSFKQALFFKECGFNLHDTMIWEKTGRGAVGSIYCYWQNFEYMFIFSKGKPKSFNPISDRKNKKTGKMKVPSGINNKGIANCHREIVAKQFGRRFNNWIINTESANQEHPAPFPEQLANDHIISWSNEGDLVYDPFSGSGTTAKMAKLNNRNYIGSEISEEYVLLSKQRISKVKKSKLHIFMKTRSKND
jgi:site-specific DNA-methyltransferase (adenine-specific)